MDSLSRGGAVAVLLAVLLVWGWPQLAPAETITVQCSFDSADLRFAKAHGFDLVTVKGGVLEGEPGEPSLPVKVVRVSVPAGAVFEGLRWSAVSAELPGQYILAPGQRPAIVGQPAAWTPPEQEAYARDAFGPSEAVVYNARHVQRGFTTLSFRVYPLAFNPAEKRLVLRKELTLKVSYRPAEEVPVIHPRNAEFFERLTERRVLNPQAVAGHAPAMRALSSSARDTGVDVLIINYHGKVAGPMARLAEWYTTKGYPAKMVTISHIWNNYPGADYQERVRNCIKDYVQTYGTLFVVLATDNPSYVRYCYVWTIGAALDRQAEHFVETYQMPTDLYFSGLDGNWDANGDGIYGQAEQEESEDPPLPAIESDQADLDYDVIVARYPVRDTGDANNLVDKVITYETDPPLSNFAKRLLFTGAVLWGYYPPGEYNGVYFDHTVSDAEMECEVMVANTIDSHWPGSTTHRLYDTYTSWDGSYPGSYSMSPSHLNSKWSAGYQFMCMNTHGNLDLWVCESGGWYYCQHVDYLNNNGKAGVILTCACNTAAFDWMDSCLSETFLRKAEKGAIIYLGCSRYGLGYPDTRQGPSMDYIEQFFDQLLNQGATLAGVAFAEHKLALAGDSEFNGPWRWLQFGVNLQGDPLVDLYTDDPQFMSPSYPIDLTAGEQSFQVTDIPADARVCLWKDPQIYEVWQGSEPVTITPGAGEMLLTISAHNYVTYQDKIYIFDPLCVGDFNGDRVRNVTDFTMLGAAYGSASGDPDYSPVIDISPEGGDGYINITDATAYIEVHGQPCPPL